MAGKSARGAAKWLAAMQGGQASQNYKEGIQAVTVNPMQLAADADQLYLQRVQEAVASGRRRNRLLAVPVSTWKDNSVNKGAQRLSSGAQAAASKVQAHFAKWGPIYDQASAAAKAIPKGGIDAALNRVRAAITVMQQAAGTA